MNLKGIVKIAVFSVIGFVLTMGLGFLTGSFGMLPSLYLSSALPTIIVAPVFVIMCKQVGQRGTAFLYFLLMGVFYVLMGMWPVIAVCAIAGLLAELVIGKKENYENKNMKIGAAFGAHIFLTCYVFYVCIWRRRTYKAISKDVYNRLRNIPLQFLHT